MFVATRGIIDKIENGNLSFDEVYESAIKFLNGDWGGLCEEDCKIQLADIEEYGYMRTPAIMGVYYSKIENLKYWIISNINETWDGRNVTVLLPEEY